MTNHTYPLLEIAFFIFYLLLFAFIITKIPFFKNCGIGSQRLIALFTLKVFAGISYAWFYTLPKYYPGSDTWRFYRLSLEETKWLTNDPKAFFKDLFVYGYSNAGNLFRGEDTYWNDLKSNVPVKMMAIMNVFTNNSYYTNIIFFNFLFLFGLAALFKLLDNLFPGKKMLIIAGIFLLPSTLFWCSGIHKDGLILSAAGLLIYSLYKIAENKFSIKNLVIILLCSVLIFSLRNYVLLAMLPAAFAWWLSHKFPAAKSLIFAAVYITGIAAFFLLPLIFFNVDLPNFVSEKRHEFLLLQGGSEVITQPLQPNFRSFVLFFPKALDMAFLRPHITEITQVSYIPAIVEIILLVFLTVISIFSLSRKVKVSQAVLFLFSYSLSILLLCGYTIPFTGAIVRYRSLFLPLLITPLLCMTDFSLILKKLRLS